MTFTPVADAYVSASASTTNYGTATTVRIDGSPVVRTFIRFNVTGLTGAVTQATLRVYANSSQSTGYGVYAVSDVTWGETTITNANAPPAASSAVGSSGPIAAGAWTAVDVTSLVKANGMYSMALITSNSTAVSLASRESGANAPQLLITTSAAVSVPVNSVLPKVVGSPQAGVSVSADPGVWSGSPTSYGFQWRLCPSASDASGCVPIGGAGAQSYAPVPGDVGSYLRVDVTATNGAGTSAPPPAQSLASPQVVAATVDPVIVAAGDIGCDPASSGFNGGLGSASSCRQRATSDVVVNANPAAVLTLGDNVYECGSTTAFAQSFDPSWGRMKPVIHPALGNHEYTSSGTGCTSTASGYFNYFGATAGDPTKGYYSYDIGSWHLIAMNANCAKVGGCGAGQPEEQWLRADLAAHANQCVLAYWHQPHFTSGPHGNDDGGHNPTGAFWQALYDYHADVVLNGHDHDYERFAPQTPGGAPDTQFGIREFVVGTGGKSQTSFSTVQPNSEIRSSGTFGVLQLTLHPTSYDWRFVPEAGKSFGDAGSTACH